MIYGVRNAYPDGHCIDADVLTTFSLEFFGDRSIGADIFHYDINTGKWESNWYYLNRGDYYNGDQMTFNLSGTSTSSGGSGLHYKNGNEYAWCAHVLQKVDIYGTVYNEGIYYPEIKVTSGAVEPGKYLKAKIGTKNAVLDNGFFISFDFSAADSRAKFQSAGFLETPRKCYMYIPGLGVYYVQVYGGVSWSTGSEDVPPCNLAIISDVINNPSLHTGQDVYIATQRALLPVDSAQSATVCIGANNALLPSSERNFGFTQMEYVVETVPDEGPWPRNYTHYIKINDEYRAIKSYNSKTGVVTLDKAFTTSPREGDAFEIYRNYVATPYYYFKCKATPTIYFGRDNISISEDLGSLECIADISRGCSVEYYQWMVMDETDSSFSVISGEIYNERLNYSYRECIPGHTYRPYLSIMTQDGVLVQKLSNAWTFPSSDMTVFNDIRAEVTDKNTVKISWTRNFGSDRCLRLNILRVNRDTNEVEFMAQGTSSYPSYWEDYKAVSNARYRYYLVADMDTGWAAAQYVDIDVKFCKWSIYFLTDNGVYELPNYSIRESYTTDMYNERGYSVYNSYSWTFDGNVSEVNITHNLEREQKTNKLGKSTVFSKGSDYDSFSLSFLFAGIANGSNEFTKYDQTTYSRWKEQVAEGCPAMIKDPKGNIWVGAVTENSRSTDYTPEDYQFYKATIGFVETIEPSRVKLINCFG